MTARTLTDSSSNRPAKRLTTHTVAAWVAFSLVGSLTVCCDLFAATTEHTQPQRIVNADAGAGHHHGSDHPHPSPDVQSKQLPPADSDHCIDNTLKDLALPKFLVPNISDAGNYISFADHRDLILPSAQVSKNTLPYINPPSTSPPLYLLFHRLLIAPRLA